MSRSARMDHEGRRRSSRTRLALVAVLAVLAGCGDAGAETGEALPVYWEAPAFALVDQSGDTLRTEDLRGGPWVAGFVFTNCTDVCPLITQRMARLRDSLREEGTLGSPVRLVSFSVDPERDTPEVLREYAGRFGGSPPAEWAFLTGSPPEAVRRTIEEGFKLTASAPPEHGHGHGTADYQVTHSPRLVLVDASGQVRGLYDTTEPGAMGELAEDLRTLLASAR